MAYLPDNIHELDLLNKPFRYLLIYLPVTSVAFDFLYVKFRIRTAEATLLHSTNLDIDLCSMKEKNNLNPSLSCITI